MGPNVTLYRSDDGTLFVGHIDSWGHLIGSQSSDAAPNWTHVVAIGHYVVFYRSDDGAFLVGYIDGSGHLVETHTSGAGSNWTHIVAIG